MPTLRVALRCMWALLVGLLIAGILTEMADQPAEAGAVILGVIAIWHQSDSKLRKPPCVTRRPPSDRRRRRREPRVRSKARRRR